MNFTTQDLHQLCNGLPNKKNIQLLIDGKPVAEIQIRIMDDAENKFVLNMISSEEEFNHVLPTQPSRL